MSVFFYFLLVVVFSQCGMSTTQSATSDKLTTTAHNTPSCPPDQTVYAEVGAESVQVSWESPFTSNVVTTLHLRKGKHDILLTLDDFKCSFSIDIKEQVKPLSVYLNWKAYYDGGCMNSELSYLDKEVISKLALHHFDNFLRGRCSQVLPGKGCRLRTSSPVLSCVSQTLTITWETDVNLIDVQFPSLALKRVKDTLREEQDSTARYIVHAWLQMVLPNRMPPFLGVSKRDGLIVTPELDVICPPGSRESVEQDRYLCYVD